MLSLRHIAHTYPARSGQQAIDALRDVSFEARAGEITVLVGPNGSGKSTLFNLLTGVLPLQNGDIRLGAASARRPRLGVVFQSPALDEQLSVWENFFYHAMLYGRRLRREQLPADLLETLGLHTRLDERIATLSGGYRRRVELAKALLTDPELLVLDEPFTGLDVSVRDDFFAVLRRLTAERSLITLAITHDLALAEMSDRVVLLESGSVVADASPAQLLSEFGTSVVEIATTDPASLSALFGEERTLQLREGALLIRDIALQDLLRVVDERDPRITDLHARRPSLEDYFIARTGHSLRDGREELLAA